MAEVNYGQKLDRRLTLLNLKDQVARLKALKNLPPTTPVLEQLPKRVKNVITGNIFDYDPLFANSPDMQVIEWATEEEEINANS